MLVQILNLKRYFGKTKAVDDISFSFRSGCIFGFVGPNGAGKTTTMRILATVDDPTEGDALIDGVSVSQYPEQARRLVGYMPDTLPTHRDMTVEDYLDFFARAYGIVSPARDRVLQQVMEFTNLSGISQKQVAELSKGMKQRVSLARAMIHNPQVLVLDEPAASLDPRARVELREMLKALASQGKAILISSHILSELAEICDGAVIIEKGKLLRAGTMAELESELATRRLIVRPTSRLEEVSAELLRTPGIVSARIVGKEVHAESTATDDVINSILPMLIQKGFAIAEFRQSRKALEEVFMKITQGEVQ